MLGNRASSLQQVVRSLSALLWTMRGRDRRMCIRDEFHNCMNWPWFLTIISGYDFRPGQQHRVRRLDRLNQLDPVRPTVASAIFTATVSSSILWPIQPPRKTLIVSHSVCVCLVYAWSSVPSDLFFFVLNWKNFLSNFCYCVTKLNRSFGCFVSEAARRTQRHSGFNGWFQFETDLQAVLLRIVLPKED